jgi:hypothetical protein
MCDSGLPCSCSAYMCVNIDDVEWYRMLYGDARDSFPSPQDVSIRNETSRAVLSGRQLALRPPTGWSLAGRGCFFGDMMLCLVEIQVREQAKSTVSQHAIPPVSLPRVDARTRASSFKKH